MKRSFVSNVIAWQRRSASEGYVRSGQFGAHSSSPTVRLHRRGGLGLATVICRKGKEAGLARALRRLTDAEGPKPGKFTTGHESEVIWSGPGQWLIVTPHPDVVATLALELADLAAVTDQSDARAILRLSGAHARDVLAKGCLIDLHPRAFQPGDVALTSISHIGVQSWQVDDTPSYDVAVPRSMIGSFWSWFEASAAEFGYSVE
jgi:sarcosine oxidase subunit gamma